MPTQLLKSAKPTPGSKSQQLPQGQQPSAPQAQQGSFSGHKEIKLTLLNKVGMNPWRLGFPAPGGLRGMDPGWREGMDPSRREGMDPGNGSRQEGKLQAQHCWDELSREGLGLAWRAAHRTSLAAHTLWWLHFGAVLAASLGHIPAAASRLFPACSKVRRVPGPFRREMLWDCFLCQGRAGWEQPGTECRGRRGS